MTDEGKLIETKLQNVLPNKVDEKDLKNYLKSLNGLSREVAKDANNYEAFSPVLQMKLDSFKSIFGEHKFDKYCDQATIIYRNIMLTRRKFNPDSVNPFFGDWKQMLLSFTASSRTQAFCNNFEKFKCVVDQLRTADNRWSQLIIFSVLRLYTTELDSREMKVLFAEHPSEFLEILIKMVDGPQHEDTSVSIRTNNAFLTELNSKAGFILSFQPYKIVCGDVYLLSDYELWMDLNMRTNVLTFMAFSVTEDKTKNVFGLASTVGLKIASRHDDLVVTSSWCLITRTDCKYQKMEIEFCFSSRIHTAILESNFSKICNISQLDRKAAPVDKNSEAELKATAQSNWTQNVNNDESAKHEDIAKNVKSQPNPVLESDVKASPNCKRSTSADREPDYGRSKKARTIVNNVPRLEPISASGARIHGLAEVILTAADDIIRTLGNEHKNYQMAGQAPNNVESLSVPHTTKVQFDRKIFERSWPIRKFMASLHDQPNYEEVGENQLPEVDDEEDFDVHYGSISNP